MHCICCPRHSVVLVSNRGPGNGDSFAKMNSLLGDFLRTGMRTKRRETVETAGNRWQPVADRIGGSVQAARQLWPLLSTLVIVCPRLCQNYGSEGWGFESLRARHVMSRDIMDSCRETSWTNFRRPAAGSQIVASGEALDHRYVDHASRFSATAAELSDLLRDRGRGG
jgi:hypothetical protein